MTCLLARYFGFTPDAYTDTQVTDNAADMTASYGDAGAYDSAADTNTADSSPVDPRVLAAIRERDSSYQPVDYAADRANGEVYDSLTQTTAIEENLASHNIENGGQATNVFGSFSDSDVTTSEANTEALAARNGDPYELTQVNTTVAEAPEPEPVVTAWDGIPEGNGLMKVVYRPSPSAAIEAGVTAGTAGALPMPGGGSGGGFGAFEVTVGVAARIIGVFALPFFLTGDSPQPYLAKGGSKPTQGEGEGDYEYKVRIPGQTGKEASSDIPSRFRGQIPRVGESGKAFADRLLKGEGQTTYPTGGGSEFNQLRKYADRGFMDPKKEP